ncbi:MAG: monovalent cation/H+ antiporter subunit D family protein [Firmicutes bacterium]|nr:monovalent cation/H+ antiporter subunit D family protein [Bacillota bacterium]
MTAAIRANLPVFAVIAPLFVAFVLPTFARRTRLVEGLVIFVQAVGLWGTAYLARLVLAQGGLPIIYEVGGWSAPWGIELVVGNLGAFFLLVVAGVSLPVAIYASGNLAKEVEGARRRAWFYVLYLLLGGALAGMSITNDLFNVFVLVEVATLSCCGLVSASQEPSGAEAAFNYLILATLGSGMILGGIGFLYIVTGHLNMGFAARALATVWQDYPHVVWMAISFFMVGFGVKAAFFPLHIWLPDAHSVAPSPASAVLSGLAVKGYIICLMKVLFHVVGPELMQVFSLNRLLVLLGMVAILIGSILALGQDELKRRLAFSTVAQIGYIFLGMGLLNVKGMTGALFHIASHGIIKSALFLAAGAVITQTGKERVSELAGVGKKMPITMGVFTIASLGLVGIPLFSGFVGKWYMLLGSLGAGDYLAAAVIVAGSVLCAGYLFPVIRVAYFEPAPADDWQEPGVRQRLALILLAMGIFVLGTIPGPLLELALAAATDFLVFN